MSPSSSSPADDQRQRPRGVRRLPNELLREMVQCVPMGWFVGAQAEQQHRHDIVQLGTVLGTYLGQAGTKFAAVVKREKEQLEKQWKQEKEQLEKQVKQWREQAEAAERQNHELAARLEASERQNQGAGHEHDTSTSALEKGQVAPNRQKFCHLCNKNVSVSNWSRHFTRQHSGKKQSSDTSAAGNSAICFNFHELIDVGSDEQFKQFFRSQLSSHNHLVAVSVYIEGMAEGQRQHANWMAVMVHFWSSSGFGSNFALNSAPVGSANEDIVGSIRDRLAGIELALDGNRRIHIIIDKCRDSQSTKPAFFDPFPFIDGNLHSEMVFPVEWPSPELLNDFFNDDSPAAVGEVGDDFEEDDWVQFDGDAKFGVGRCASRLLEAVLRTVFERDTFMVQLRKRIFCLLGQLVFSHSACSLLHSRSGGLLPLFPVNSRWASLEHVYARLLNLSSVLGPVCAEFKFPVIEDNDWKIIEEVLEVADNFHKLKTKLEQDTQPTISLLYPSLNLLLNTLQNANQIPSVAKSLINLIKRSFLDVLSPDHNSLFLCASMLDPKVAYLLVQEHKEEGVAAVRKLVTKTVIDPTVFVRTQSTESGDNAESPFGFETVKRARFSVGIGKKQAGEGRDQIDQEIAQYLAYLEKPHLFLLDCSDTCAQFWNKHEQKFPMLSQTAKSVLVIPATCAGARYLSLFGPKPSADPSVSTAAGNSDSGRQVEDTVHLQPPHHDHLQ